MDIFNSPTFFLWSDKQNIGHLQLCSEPNYFGSEWVNIGKFETYYKAAEFAENSTSRGCNAHSLRKAYEDFAKDFAESKSDNNQHYDFHMINSTDYE